MVCVNRISAHISGYQRDAHSALVTVDVFPQRWGKIDRHPAHRSRPQNVAEALDPEIMFFSACPREHVIELRETPNGGGKELKEPPGAFGAGVVCAHLGITLAYLTVLKNNRLGDIVGMSQSTGYTKTQLSLAMAIPGALDAWRLLGNEVPEWVPQVSLASKGIGIARIWTY